MKSWRHTEYVTLSCGLENKQELIKQGLWRLSGKDCDSLPDADASEKLSQGPDVNKEPWKHK